MLWDTLLKVRDLTVYQMNNSDMSNYCLEETIRKLNEFDADLAVLIDGGEFGEPPQNHGIWRYYNPVQVPNPGIVAVLDKLAKEITSGQ